MAHATYLNRRREIETYFARTAAETWSKLTSDTPVGRIRATVRAGRDEMRRQLLDRLPADLAGARLLDAGCGTGALAVEAARRGADVVATDISEPLIRLARERVPADLDGPPIRFRVGDMLDPELGRFDHAVAMDSLIHYDARDMCWALSTLAARTERSLLFTFAPGTPALAVMHALGQLFPRGNRSPAIQPVGERGLRQLIAEQAGFEQWSVSHSRRVSRGFYISQAMELSRA